MGAKSIHMTVRLLRGSVTRQLLPCLIDARFLNHTLHICITMHFPFVLMMLSYHLDSKECQKFLDFRQHSLDNPAEIHPISLICSDLF